MPAFTTHYLFGVNSYHHLDNPEIKACIRKNSTVYSLGIQGPDPYFFYPLTHVPFLPNLGNLAHESKTGLFFKNMLIQRNKLKLESEREIADAYIYGFLGHYALDCSAHPYIYCRTKYDDKHNPAYDGRHMGLEGDIDAQVLLLLRRKVPTQFCHPATIRMTPYQKHVVTSLLRYAFRHTYPEETKYHLPMSGPLHSIQIAARILWDPHNCTKRLLGHFEQVFFGHPFLSGMIMSKTGKRHYEDPLNLRKRTWHNPWDKSLISNESFVELFQKGRANHIAYMNAAYQVFTSTPENDIENWYTFAQTVGHKSYHSGLDV